MPEGIGTLMKGAKAQSAMEYLTTYGWAILILAIVILALFSLGVFNPSYWAPRAQPGSCHVYRPLGPGTTQGITLSGQCTSFIPTFVTSLSSTSSLTMNDIRYMPYITSAGQNSITLTMWTAPFASDTFSQLFGYDGSSAAMGGNPYPLLYNDVPSPAGCGPGGNPFAEDPGVAFGGSPSDFVQPLTQCALPYSYHNQMDFYVLEYTGAQITIYVGVGGQIAPCTLSYPCSAPLSLGSNVIGSPGILSLGGGCCGSFTGFVSNFQAYNTSLSANSVAALYQEGVGGAPIDLQNLVGWWMLNGDTNDYSGNNNGGVQWVGSPSFVESWTSTYSAP